MRRLLCFLFHYHRHWRLISIGYEFEGQARGLKFYCLRCHKDRGLL